MRCVCLSPVVACETMLAVVCMWSNGIFCKLATFTQVLKLISHQIFPGHIDLCAVVSRIHVFFCVTVKVAILLYAVDTCSSLVESGLWCMAIAAYPI